MAIDLEQEERRLMRPVRRMRGHQKKLAQILEKAREDIFAIEAQADAPRRRGEPEVTPEVVDERLLERHTRMEEEVAAVEADVKAEHAKAQEVTKPKQVTDPTEVLARETKATRTWNRLRSLLDEGSVEPLQLIADNRGDLDVLNVLAEELPIWSRTHGRGAETEMLTTEIADYIPAALPDVGRLAFDARAAADRAAKTAEHNLAIVRKEGLEAPLLVGDNPGEAIELGGDE